MTHRLRFLPLALILAGVALALVLGPSESSAAVEVEKAQVSRGDARVERRAAAALRIARPSAPPRRPSTWTWVARRSPSTSPPAG